MDDSLADIPSNKSDWDIDVLNKLIKLKDIESDTFDFKSDYKKLSLYLCAFANNSFGQMVLGIKEFKKGQVLYGFKKEGFPENDLNSIQGEINNAMVNVDPAPRVTISTLNGNRLVYPIIKIEGENSKKPYFQKGTGICFVRIGSSSVPASRTTILNLFSDIMRKIENVEKLKASAEFLNEMIMYTCEKLETENYEDPVSRITPLDLSLIKNCT
jgi:predicted HTH transcriptional regulator